MSDGLFLYFILCPTGGRDVLLSIDVWFEREHHVRQCRTSSTLRLIQERELSHGERVRFPQLSPEIGPRVDRTHGAIQARAGLESR